MTQPALSRLIALVALLLPGQAAGAAPMSVADLFAVKWVKQPTVAPDGRMVAFVVSSADRDKNKQISNLYLVPRAGGPLRQLTNHPSSNTSPAFSPDGKRLAFISSRSGEAQLWIISTEGGEAQQLTHLSTEADGPLLWSPDGKLIAFVSQVYPQCKDDACNRRKLEEEKASKVKARVFRQLMIRHWNAWLDERRQHIFVAPADGTAAPRDLTPGPHNAPPLALGGERDYAFSPDGKLLAYVTNTETSLATSTNNDVFEVPVSGGGPARRLTTGPGNDNSPRYSPDGRRLAWLSMSRAGYESDRPRVMVRERASGQVKEWSADYAGHPLDLLWSPDSQTLYFNAPHRGRQELFAATAQGGVRQLSQGRYASQLTLCPDGRQLVFVDEAAHRPPELAVVGVDGGGARELTALNTWLTKQRSLQPAEHHWFTSSDGTKVHAVLVKPPGWSKGRRYPAMVMIHGGPQGETGDSFHPRWNLQMFATAGYVVFGINFRGSLGFGQPFSEAITADWGGQPFQDILKGTDYLASLPYVQPKRICAAGASYGGYMVNWIGTQTQRFTCLISHAGLFNLESEYGATEELWFPEWETRGTPWTNRELYRKWSPHSYAERLKTPTLVIHGQLDYRVPVEQGLQLFTALQRQHVPSQLLYFPDEDHFVRKPQNIELWWRTMREWLARYLNK